MLIRTFWLGLLIYLIVAFFIYLCGAKRTIATEYDMAVFFILAPVLILKEVSAVTFFILSIFLLLSEIQFWLLLFFFDPVLFPFPDEEFFGWHSRNLSPL